jgi:hypothetical protein
MITNILTSFFILNILNKKNRVCSLYRSGMFVRRHTRITIILLHTHGNTCGIVIHGWFMNSLGVSFSIKYLYIVYIYAS